MKELKDKIFYVILGALIFFVVRTNMENLIIHSVLKADTQMYEMQLETEREWYEKEREKYMNLSDKLMSDCDPFEEVIKNKQPVCETCK